MADTLREYLIALGFKVDDATYKKFDKAIAGAKADVVGLGSAVVTTAAAIGVAVEKITKEFEDLAYLSQRTGASVNNLKAYDYAARQIGLTTSQSQGAIESFTTAMLLNPGIRGFVRNFGVADGDPTRMLTDFVSALKKRYGETQYFVAAMQAEMAGIPEQVFRRYWDNLDRNKVEEADIMRRRREAGVDSNKLAQESVVNQRALTRLFSDLGIAEERFGLGFTPQATLATNALADMVEWLNKADRATAGLGYTFAALSAGSLAAFLAKLALAPTMFASIGNAAGALGGALTRILGPLGAAIYLIGLGQEASETPEGKSFKASGNLIQDIYGWLRTVKPTLQRRMGLIPEAANDNNGLPAGVASGGRDAAAVREARIRDAAQTLGIDPNVAMRVARSEGFNGYKSSIPGEQSFGDFQLHVTPGGRGHAVGDQFQKDTGLDPRDPANEAAMDEYALKWAKAHGWGDFHGAANTGIGRFDGINNTPLTSGSGSTGPVTVTQTNNNHIVANNAREAGDALDRANDRAQGDLVRNFQGLTR